MRSSVRRRCDAHPKVVELRELTQWAEGMVWCSPERHGAMTGIMKTQFDWIPLSVGAVRPTQGKTLAVMQVCGGSQSFNAVNQMRVLGRWMRMLTIPNQSSVAKAFLELEAWSAHEAEFLRYLRHRLRQPAEAEDVLHGRRRWSGGSGIACGSSRADIRLQDFLLERVKWTWCFPG